MAAFVHDPGVNGDLAHPPRWAAILDLCPKAAWPIGKPLTRAYLLHVQDGDEILLWGRLIFADMSESVGFVTNYLKRRLRAQAPKQTQWLSRIVKRKNRSDMQLTRKWSEERDKIGPEPDVPALRHTAPGALGRGEKRKAAHEQRIARSGQEGHGKS